MIVFYKFYIVDNDQRLHSYNNTNRTENVNYNQNAYDDHVSTKNLALNDSAIKRAAQISLGKMSPNEGSYDQASLSKYRRFY